MRKLLTLRAAALAAALLASSCGGDSKKVSCPAGEENCECKTDGTCSGDLECKEGFCVPTQTTCTLGQEGCECLTDGTCGAATDGTALVCTEGLCVKEGTPVGGLGDPCDDTTPCGLNEGVQLECTDGKCQLPETPCTAGTLDCQCDGGTCDEGLVCLEELCQAQGGSGVQIGNPDVRSCDVLFELAGAKVAYSAEVLGVVERDGDRVALSFTARTDKPLGTIAVLSDDVGTPVGKGLVPTQAQCFDRLGKAVAEPQLSFK